MAVWWPAGEEENAGEKKAGKSYKDGATAAMLKEFEKLALVCPPLSFLPFLSLQVCGVQAPLASRPDLGKAGSPIALFANFFAIDFQAKHNVISRYYVDIIHPGKNRKLTRFPFLPLSSDAMRGG